MKRCYDLVEVLWEDAAALPHGWNDKPPKVEPHMALSVGYLIINNKEAVVLAMDSDFHGQHCSLGQIPKGMVRKITVLRRKKGAKETRASKHRTRST